MTLPARLLEKFEANSVGCWIWKAAADPSGYGRCRDENGRSRNAHVVFYESLRGPVPSGLELDHLCRVRACVNPLHLEPVTRRENVLRGEGPCAANARKTHCYVGHKFTAENTRIGRSGRERACRECESIYSRKWNAAHPERSHGNHNRKRDRNRGGVPEWSIGAASKAVSAHAHEGSTPSPTDIRFATVGASW